MEWTDDGIVLGTRRHGEASAILELMTREHGRHLGLVRGGAGTRLRPVLQPRNRVSANRRARLDEHLGYYAVEGIEFAAANFLSVAHAVYGVTHLAALCRLLPERDPHPRIHAELAQLLSCLTDAQRSGPQIVRFELGLLAELGFGLDLQRCAATGTTEDLAYVSPRSGRAVSREAGLPWDDKLLRLPGFLNEGEGTDGPRPSVAELEEGFSVTGYFLQRHVFEARRIELPDVRARFVSAVISAYRSLAVGSRSAAT
jgi:DNA repair protein RecO (recombination protein O)